MHMMTALPVLFTLSLSSPLSLSLSLLQFCEIECGYECKKQSGMSFGYSTCADGILASDEMCEMATVDQMIACNPFTCQVTEGWTCDRIDCGSTLERLDAKKKQRCLPFCGDRRIIPDFELCDEGDNTNYLSNFGEDWPRPWSGGNGVDRVCSDKCEPNRLFQCLGCACASRQAPAYEQQDVGMPLLQLLFAGHDVSLSQPHIIQGLQLSTAIRQEETSSVLLGKRLFLQPTTVGSPTNFRATGWQRRLRTKLCMNLEWNLRATNAHRAREINKNLRVDLKSQQLVGIWQKMRIVRGLCSPWI